MMMIIVLCKHPVTYHSQQNHDFYHNQNCLKHFFQVPPNLSGCPDFPDIGKDGYLFPYEDDMYNTDISNMSRETENEYVIMKFNFKAIKEM
eukprot:13253666-Ditylum_brightwellii.AAC.1